MNKPIACLILLASVLCGLTPSAFGQAITEDTKCEDWSQKSAFEPAVAEYMRLVNTQSTDAGCVARAAFYAIDDLFDPANDGLYIERLKAFDAQYRHKDAKEDPAFQDMVLLMQHRWLGDYYSLLSRYNSDTVIHATEIGIGASVALLGAGLLLHNPALDQVRGATRSITIRMMKYLGAFLLAKELGIGVSNYKDSKETKHLKILTPPLDLIGGSTYWNYTDLHFMRDLGGLVADTAAFTITNAAVTTYLAIRKYKVLGDATLSVRSAFKGSWPGMAVAYAVGYFADKAVKDALTSNYHHEYRKETVQLVKDLADPSLSDWKRYTLAARLSTGAMTWVSTQDIVLQEELEGDMESFRHIVVCGRLIRRVDNEPNLIYWPRPFTIDSASFDAVIARQEDYVHASFAKRIDQKRTRLLGVREGLTLGLMALEEAKKPYLRNFVVQQKALLTRIDRYLGTDPLLEEEIQSVHATLKGPLGVNAETWKDEEALKSISKDFHCS